MAQDNVKRKEVRQARRKGKIRRITSRADKKEARVDRVKARNTRIKNRGKGAGGRGGGKGRKKGGILGGILRFIGTILQIGMLVAVLVLFGWVIMAVIGWFQTRKEKKALGTEADSAGAVENKGRVGFRRDRNL